MIHRRINGKTRELGRAQGYVPLYVRDEQINGHLYMRTAWEPTPDELVRLNQGASFEIIIMGNVHPPIKIEVGQLEDKV